MITLNTHLQQLAAEANKTITAKATDVVHGDHHASELLVDIMLCEWLVEEHGIARQGRLRGKNTIIEFHPAIWRNRGEFSATEIVNAGVPQLAARWRRRYFRNDF